ncbi:MAG: hypothetical protein IT392_03320 [Nitrospirae bacterium]|nr:hypothetical protein [Nitrospirota bacterium]
MKNNSLSNGRPSAAVICFIIAIVLSAGILTGCGGSGSSGNGNDHLNGIDSTHSMNLGVTTWKSVESG